MQKKYYAADPHNLIAVEKGRAYPSDTPQNNVYTRAAAAIEDWIHSQVVVRTPRHLFMRTRRNTRCPGPKSAGRGADLSARENSRNIPRASFSAARAHTLRAEGGPAGTSAAHEKHTPGKLFMLYSDAEKRIERDSCGG